MDVGREVTGEGSSLPGARSAPVSMDWRGPRGGPWPMSKLTVRPGVGAGAADRGVPGKAGRVGATGVSPWMVWEAAGSLCMGLGAADRAPPARPAPAAAASPAWPWEGDIRARSCSIHKVACFKQLAQLEIFHSAEGRSNLCCICGKHEPGCALTRSGWPVQSQFSASGQRQAYSH